MPPKFRREPAGASQPFEEVTLSEVIVRMTHMWTCDR